MVFTEIDATEYLDDLWGRDGPHMLHITKFEEVCICCYRVCVFIRALYILYKRKYWREYSQRKYFGDLNIDNLYLISKYNCSKELILTCTRRRCACDYLMTFLAHFGVCSFVSRSSWVVHLFCCNGASILKYCSNAIANHLML